MLKEIKLVAEEKTVHATGKKFIAFKAIQKNGTLVTAKFRKELANVVPQTPGRYIVKADSNAMNLNTSKLYPELWFEAVESIEPDDLKPNRDEVDELLNELF